MKAEAFILVVWEHPSYLYWALVPLLQISLDFPNCFGWGFLALYVTNLTVTSLFTHMANLLMENKLSVAQMLPSKGCAWTSTATPTQVTFHYHLAVKGKEVQNTQRGQGKNLGLG